jgi:hypothetical protein
LDLFNRSSPRGLRLIVSLLTALAAPQSGLAQSPTAAPEQQFPLYRAVMAQPFQAAERVGRVTQRYREAVDSPSRLMVETARLAGLTVPEPDSAALREREAALRAQADPLAVSLAWLAPLSQASSPWTPDLQGAAGLSMPLRLELARVVSALGRAHGFLQCALAHVPPGVTPELLRRQALDGRINPLVEPDFRTLLPLMDHDALLAGMLDLMGAVQRLKSYVATTRHLLQVAWTLDTPLGRIVVDTTGRDNVYVMPAPLLLLDVGGSDRYEFLPRSNSHSLSVLLDHQGDDHYVSATPGADPSAATLGYGILWDTQGDDRYEGTQQAQASALFGAALLVDGGGHNRWTASSHAQAYAIGGLAVLSSGSGHDQFTAQTHSQASAGPRGVAVLIDAAGNDRYILNNTPLMRPSPQLPERNTSMGQGAGRGLRADSLGSETTAGGIGLLLDLAGDDEYSAQVFAQGAGYQEGLGLLVDEAGNDRFEAAWYAMGAAAHLGAGVLLKRGAGHDSYQASHSMAMGAAHDFSVGVLVDEGGNDRYVAADLSLGAAHDHSTALLLDASGNDRYEVPVGACRVLGAAHISEWGSPPEDFLNLGLFIDLGGSDTYPKHCADRANNAVWSGRPGGLGLGMDGEFGRVGGMLWNHPATGGRKP